MKKLLLTFDDNPNSCPKQCIFHNTEDMVNWFSSKSDIFTEFKVSDDIVSFTVKHAWTSFAKFEYIQSYL